MLLLVRQRTIFGGMKVKIKEVNIGFLGFGNMAQAIAQGWVQSDIVRPTQLYASARNQEKLAQLTSELGIKAIASNEELVREVDVVILAVKPYQIVDVLQPLKEILEDKILVSVAVNYLNTDFNKLLGENVEHLSTLPNTPIGIGHGIILFEADHTLSEDSYQLVTKLFEAISLVEVLPSEQMGIGGVISGSAPAFVDLFIEALGDVGVKHGLNRQTAYRLASKMISGTGELQLATGKHPGELKDAITSPNGTTIKGIASLEKNGFRGTIIDAVDAVLED